MSFVVANDKKIRLFKLGKEFCADFRRQGVAEEEIYEERDDGKEPVDSSFVERFQQSNGQIIFPKSKAYNDLQQ